MRPRTASFLKNQTLGQAKLEYAKHFRVSITGGFVVLRRFSLGHPDIRTIFLHWPGGPLAVIGIVRSGILCSVEDENLHGKNWTYGKNVRKSRTFFLCFAIQAKLRQQTLYFTTLYLFLTVHLYTHACIWAIFVRSNDSFCCRLWDLFTCT
jgi:hypothetical protein